MEKPISHIVNLNPYFNSKGVSWLEPKIIAQLEHTGHSLPGEMLPNNEKIICGNIPFHFPKTDTLENDHISCEGQVVLTQCEKPYNRVAFLGCTSWGDYRHTIELIYQDNDQENKSLGFSDWARLGWGSGPLLFDEEVAITIPYHRQNETSIDISVGIWLQKVHLNKDKVLDSIELPDNPYMYIFAISLFDE